MYSELTDRDVQSQLRHQNNSITVYITGFEEAVQVFFCFLFMFSPALPSLLSLC